MLEEAARPAGFELTEARAAKAHAARGSSEDALVEDEASVRRLLGI